MYEFDGLRVKKLHACDYIGVIYTINLLNIWLRILKIFMAENNEPSALGKIQKRRSGPLRRRFAVLARARCRSASHDRRVSAGQAHL